MSEETILTLTVLVMGFVFGFLIGMIYYGQEISSLKSKIKELEAQLRGFITKE